MPLKAQDSNVQGFSLVEVLIALFIFTLVAFILSKALHTVISAQAATEKHAEQLREIQLAMVLFSRDLEQAVDRPISSTEGEREAAFKGTPESFSFTHLGFAKPERTRYRYDSGQFWRDRWSSLDRYSETPQSRLLLSGLTQVNFRYLDNKKHFHFFWPPGTEATPLPLAVELNLHFKTGETLQQTYLLPAHQVPHAA